MNIEKLELQYNSFKVLPNDWLMKSTNALNLKLKYLNMEYNEIKDIQPDTFNYITLIEELFLGHNSLEKLNDKMLIKLKQLRILNLSGNFINELIPGVFGGIDSIQSIDISNNNLYKLSNDIFDDKIYKYLINFNISHNKIMVVDDNSFKNIPNLQNLDLSNNQIVIIFLFL